MSYPTPLLLIAGPLVAAGITLFLRRWRRTGALVGTVMAWWLGLWVSTVPLDAGAGGMFAGDTWPVLGRAFVLADGVQALFLFLYVGLGLLFLGAWFFPQGQYFVPASLAAFSLLAAALMVQPLSFGTLFLLAAMAILVVVIQAERVGSTRAAWRYLVIAVLAVPFFMVAGWALDTEQAHLMALVSRLLAAGFIILLAGFPFHIWVNPVVNQAPPLASVLVSGLAQLAIVAFLFNWLGANPWLEQERTFGQILRWSGAATVALAGLTAATASTSGRLLGSLLLLDMGMAVLALSLPGPTGWQAAVTLTVMRFFALLPATIGLILLRRQGNSDEIAANKGLARRAAWSTALFVYACLSLLGLPLTPGFGSRWAIVTALNQPAALAAPWLPLLLLLAMLGGAAGVLRALASWMQPPTEPAASALTVERPWLRGVLVLALTIAFGLALFPQALINYATRIADLLV